MLMGVGGRGWVHGLMGVGGDFHSSLNDNSLPCPLHRSFLA